MSKSTTFYLNQVLHREFKAKCALRKESMKTVIERFMAKYVSEGEIC